MLTTAQARGFAPSLLPHRALSPSCGRGHGGIEMKTKIHAEASIRMSAEDVAIYLAEEARAYENHVCVNDQSISDCNPKHPCSHHTCGIPA